MSNFFGRLFSTATPPTDGLSQTQREAIVDLLYFCMCADQRLLPVENTAIFNEVATFNWEPTIEFSAFAERSLAREQAAVKTPEVRKSALDEIAGRLVSTETRVGPSLSVPDFSKPMENLLPWNER